MCLLIPIFLYIKFKCENLNTAIFPKHQAEFDALWLFITVFKKKKKKKLEF